MQGLCFTVHTSASTNRRLESVIVQSHKGFIATTSLVSYVGHPKQVSKQLLQQRALVCFSHATQSVSQQH